MGGRIGYSLATGIVIALVCFLGLTALLLKVIPLVAILPILLYIGLVIGAQAFQASPANHAPAVVLAIIPNIAERAKINIDGALTAAGTSAAKLGSDKLGGVGVVYDGIALLGSGSVLAGMVLGAMAAFIIDRKLNHAAWAAFTGAVLAFVGLIHAGQLGWAASPSVALGYALFGVVCLIAGRQKAARARQGDCHNPALARVPEPPMSHAFDDRQSCITATGPSFDDLLSDPARRTVLRGALGAAVAAVFPACSWLPGLAGPLTGFKPIPVSGDDAVRVPEGYRADVLVAWGDPIGDPAGMPPFRFDASNTAAEQALQSGTHHDGMYFFPLPQGASSSDHGLLVMNHEYPDHNCMFPDGRANWSAEKVRKSQHAVGCSVQEVRLVNGRWEMVRPSPHARRIHGNTAMRVGGPAAGHPLMRTKTSASGMESYGTFNNCANGWTPWGTYLTCEENFSFHFKPASDPTAREERYELTPKVRFSFNWGDVDPRFDVAQDRNQPNHFGWVVEIDPYDRDARPVKRTAMGRCSHEGACPAVAPDGRVAFYTGDDRVFEYLYKFVTARPWNPRDRAANRDLLDEGTLYVARFDADGTGTWIELTHGRNGLTAENGFASQADVVIYARAAGDRVGATRMDRPEWAARHPFTGDMYCTLTNNFGRGGAGVEGPNAANRRAPNRFGQIIRWRYLNNDYAATRFHWDTFVLAGDPGHADERVRGDIQGDLFASPDGLMIDGRGVIWVQTDVSPALLLKDDHAVYGNNQMLAMDPVTRETKRFLTGPRGCEITGACMTPDGRTLFVNIQHPGEVGAIGVDAKNPRSLSNWPDFRPDGRPRSATVVVRRGDGGVIGT